MSNMGFKKW